MIIENFQLLEKMIFQDVRLERDGHYINVYDDESKLIATLDDEYRSPKIALLMQSELVRKIKNGPYFPAVVTRGRRYYPVIKNAEGRVFCSRVGKTTDQAAVKIAEKYTDKLNKRRNKLAAKV